MAELLQTEYFVLRYVPNVVQGEFANIGIIALRADASGRQAEVRLTDDWRRARALDPSLDVEFFAALQEELQEWLNSDVADCSRGGGLLPRREWILEMLRDCASNCIQLSGGNALGSPREMSLEKVAADLLKQYCGGVTFVVERETPGRLAIRSSILRAFEEAGLRQLLHRNIAVSKYVMKGDPLKIDFGLPMERRDEGDLPGAEREVQGSIDLFHAVSLPNNVDLATVLAYSYQPLREGIRRVEGRLATLTAVTEDRPDPGNETTTFAMNLLQQQGVIVRHVSQMREIAASARRAMNF